MTPYKNQNQDQEKGITANGPAYREDNRIPAGRELNGWPTTVRFPLKVLLLSSPLFIFPIKGPTWGRGRLRTYP